MLRNSTRCALILLACAAATAQENAPLSHVRARLAAGKPVRVLCYGDSISEVGRHERWHGGASKPTNNYGHLLVNKLAEASPEATFEVDFFAIGGQNTYEGLGRVLQLREYEVDLVLLAFGTNDCNHHYLLPEQTRQAMAELIAQTRRLGEHDVVVLGTGGDNPEAPFFKIRPGPIVAATAAAAKAKGARFVDIRGAILAATEDGERWADFHLNRENVHPNDAGHEVWAETIFAALQAELLRE